MSRLKDMRGFTLVELMITIAILAIVLSIAAPSFRDILLNNRINTAAQEMHAALQIARSEAVKLKQTVTLCAANEDFDECEKTTDWAKGWLLILNNDEVLKVWTVSDGLNITGPEDGIIVLASGMLKTVGIISAQEKSCSNGVKQTVKISLTGIVKMEKGSC